MNLSRLLVLSLVATGFVVSCESSKDVRAQPRPIVNPDVQAQLTPAKPWTPPKSNFPPEFVENTQFLLAHGLGDPRGGKFVSAKVIIASSWDGGGEAEILGWLIPKEGGNPERLIGTDGLVYRPLQVIGPADVKDALVDKPPTSQEYSHRDLSIREGKLSLLPCLLLVAGETSLVEKSGDLKAPFEALANLYLVNKFHQAVSAHMRGDDQLALDQATDLQLNRQAFIDEQRKQGKAIPGQVQSGDAFQFLAPIDDLVADSKRRLMEGTPKPIDFSSLKSLPQQKRIQELITALDQVSARQWGQPGGVSLYMDPIVKALVEEGDEAVQPLIDTIENDRRLTRSVSFGRDFFPSRHLITVREAAYSTFLTISQSFDYFGQSPIDVPAIRAYWKERGKFSPAKRWVMTLTDDQATPQKWVDAARELTSPEGMVRVGMTTLVGTEKQSSPMKGESLRTGQSPSISELLAKRTADSIAPASPGDIPQQFQLQYGLELALSLYKWDRPSSLDSLRLATNALMQAASHRNGEHLVLAYPRLLGEAMEGRVSLGDQGALKQYKDWLSSVHVRGIGFDADRLFLPFVNRPIDPEVQRLANDLFLSPNSAWNLNQPWKKGEGQPPIDALTLSPALVLNAVRNTVLERLSDSSIVGTASIEKNLVRIQTNTISYSQSYGLNGESDPQMPKVGTQIPIRFGDRVADSLSKLEGAPAFKPYWPQASRDKAIARIRKFVESHAKNVRDLLPWPNSWEDHPKRPGSP